MSGKILPLKLYLSISHDNMTLKQQRSLKDFGHLKDVIINPSGKGGNMANKNV